MKNQSRNDAAGAAAQQTTAAGRSPPSSSGLRTTMRMVTRAIDVLH